MQNQRLADAVRPDRRYNLLINTTLLLIHLAFAVVYARLGTPALFYYNLFSIAVFMAGYVAVLREWTTAYYIAAYSEVYLFTTLNLLLLGWGCGFELYCFSYAISIQLVSFMMARERVAKSMYIIVGGITAVYFLAMRLVTWEVSPVYSVPEEARRGLYLANALIALTLCVNYVGLFTRIVYLLASDLHYDSTHDALTNLYNRREMWDLMDNDRVAEHGGAAVAMVDIDDFKQINDTLGHETGDEVLRALAERLKALEGGGLYTSRWGGEEFVIFCGRDDAAYYSIRRRLEDFVRRCAATPVMVGERRVDFTVTVGLVMADHTADVQSLVNRADELLYEGKQSGKNRLVVGTLEN